MRVRVYVSVCVCMYEATMCIANDSKGSRNICQKNGNSKNYVNCVIISSLTGITRANNYASWSVDIYPLIFSMVPLIMVHLVCPQLGKIVPLHSQWTCATGNYVLAIKMFYFPSSSKTRKICIKYVIIFRKNL